MADDKIYLAEDILLKIGDERQGYNDNVLVFGQTGSGKTFSINIPTALHLKESSCVMAFSKRKDAEMMLENFTDKGYEVIDLNFAEPSKSKVVFDPLNYIETSEDAINLANTIIENGKDISFSGDPYWLLTAESLCTALICAITMPDISEAKIKPHLAKDPRCSFSELITMSQMLMSRKEVDGRMVCELDKVFIKIEELFGNCLAVQSYNVIRGLSMKTATCIVSQVVSSINAYVSQSVIDMMRSDTERLDFKKLGRKRTALIITTSPVNKALNSYLALMYTQMFKALYEDAEKNGGRLDNRVMVFVDDCGQNRIEGLQNHISVFREAGISTVMFLQSEEQLKAMYGDKANIIKDNSGTIAYFTGSQNLSTCEGISKRIDRPLNEVLSMPIGNIIICRNGQHPVTVPRYKTLEDALYRECYGERDCR